MEISIKLLSLNLFNIPEISIKLLSLNLFNESLYSDNATQNIKSSLYLPYYAEACNEWRGPSPRLSAWATQLRTNVATVARRWRHCDDLIGPGIEPQTSRTDSVRLATELTGRYNATQVCSKKVLLVSHFKQAGKSCSKLKQKTR